MSGMMDRFPPPPGAQVTLANGRMSPFNRWGFQHAREIVPLAGIANDPVDLRRLPPVDTDFAALAFDEDYSPPPAQSSHTVRGFLAGLKKKGIQVEILERVRVAGVNKEGAKGSFTVYRIGGAR